MKKLLSRSSLLGALLLLPACASLAQDPQPYRNVAYSAEEMDNLVAPVALYPDALLAHILVAATFPDQVAVAHQYVRERGTRNIDDQGWDVSVKAVAYYPPVLNMLATQDDWAVALGQAYASQSADVMDAVQRLREMAREQGNLVSTREHTVTEDRGRIIIVPANPQVIYVPTYDPAIVYVRPIWGFGFHTGYFSFGIGFPIGSWLGYDIDWWGHYGHHIYYSGWYDGWRYPARRYFTVVPVYVRPRYSIVNVNVNIFSRRVNYINLDRRHRYVRRSVVFERHDRDRRYTDRDGWSRDDDRRGPYTGTRGDDGGYDDRRSGGSTDRDNDRIGNRLATFDDFRPDRGGQAPDARDAEPLIDRSGAGAVDRRRETTLPGRTRNETGGGNARSAERGSNAPVLTAPQRTREPKGNGTARTQGPEYRSASRPNAPVMTAPERSSKSNGNSRPSLSEFRSAPRSEPRILSAPQRSTKSNGNSRPSSSEFRSAPRSNAPVYSAPQRSVERGSSGGSAQLSRPTMRSSPGKSSSSGSVARPSGGGSGSVRPSGGGGGGGGNPRGGGKGRKQ